MPAQLEEKAENGGGSRLSLCGVSISVAVLTEEGLGMSASRGEGRVRREEAVVVALAMSKTSERPIIRDGYKGWAEFTVFTGKDNVCDDRERKSV
jgi:hypothetical protein